MKLEIVPLTSQSEYAAIERETEFHKLSIQALAAYAQFEIAGFVLFEVDPKFHYIGEEPDENSLIMSGLYVREFYWEPHFRQLELIKQMLGVLVEVAQASHKEDTSVRIQIEVSMSDPELGSLLHTCGFELFDENQERQIATYAIDAGIRPSET